MPLLGENSRVGGAEAGLTPSRRRRLPPASDWQDVVMAESLDTVSGTGSGPRKNTATDFREGSKASGTGVSGLLATCANAACASGWLHLWRSRSGPIFEHGWSCSAACTAVRMELAIRREMEGRLAEPSIHRHRVPLGLMMLEQGWITPEQLRQALAAQKASGQGKLGKWLVRQQGVSEQLVTRALSLQWNCPVLPLDYHDPGAMAVAMPRLFLEAFGSLPMRIAAGKILYLGFEERLDPVVALAVERMLGLRVETGLVMRSRFLAAHERMLTASFPRTSLIEAASESPLVRVLTKAVERARPIESRLVRVHDCLWLRMWLQPQIGALPEIDGVEDVICSLAPN